MKKGLRLFIVTMLVYFGNGFAECQSGLLKFVTIEHIAGYQSVDFAGTARFGMEYGTSSQLNGYVSDAQQNMNQLYTALLTAFTAGSKVEICVDENPAGFKGGYERLSRISMTH